MARRVDLKNRLVFAGGVAKNPCITRLLSQKLGVELTTPDEPQIVGALGAAIIAQLNGMRTVSDPLEDNKIDISG